MMVNQSSGAATRKDLTRVAWPEIALGLGVTAAAIGAGWQASLIPVSPLYSKVGPTIFPKMAAVMLFALGALLVVQGLRGGWQPADEREIPLDWRALGLVGAGLVANAALIGPLGFTLASTLLFTLVAAGFGSRRPWVDAPMGFVLALAAYFGFAGALGVNIGAGPFERALGAALGL
jgi:putative tricarboxylic transport membrane protein